VSDLPESKSEAIALGYKRYFNGKECLRGHIAERTLGGNCAECLKEKKRRYREQHPNYRKEYYQKNKERENANSSRYHLEHKKERREYARKWAMENAELRAAFQSEWREKNPDYAANHKANNRHLYKVYANRRRNRLASGVLSAGIVTRLYALQKGRCACCSCPLDDSFHLDHIVPLCRGGENTDNNVQLLTAGCNLRKGRKRPEEYMQQVGNLI